MINPIMNGPIGVLAISSRSLDRECIVSTYYELLMLLVAHVGRWLNSIDARARVVIRDPAKNAKSVFCKIVYVAFT